MIVSHLFRNVLILSLACGIMAGLLSCGTAVPVDQPTPQPSIETSPQDSASNAPGGGRYIDCVFDEATVEKDIPYATVTDYLGNEQTLLLDVYTPKGDNETKRPAILFVHGGGFYTGNKDGGFEVILGKAFAQKGYVCLSIDYRLRNEQISDWEGTLSDAVNDTYAALAWTIDHSGDYGIDPARIALSGYSAGATTVTGLCYNEEIDLPGDATKTVFAIVNMSGGDFGLGSVSPDAPPCLITHGSEDGTIPFMSGTRCSESLTAAGVENTFYVLDGCPHDINARLQEVEDVVAIFLYEQLTGTKPDISIRKGS